MAKKKKKKKVAVAAKKRVPRRRSGTLEPDLVKAGAVGVGSPRPGPGVPLDASMARTPVRRPAPSRARLARMRKPRRAASPTKGPYGCSPM